MLPPLSPTVPSSNPKFGALYQDLCNNKLNSDGSTKLDAKAQRERDTLSENLRAARIEATKRNIVKSGLQEISYRPDHLSEDLQELVAIVVTILEGHIPEDDKDLLREDLLKFKENVTQIIIALAKLIEQDAGRLSTIIDSDNPPSTEQMSVYVDDMKSGIAESRSNVTQSRLAIAKEASSLHVLYRHILETSIRILEQTIHGSVARNTKAKADYLALVAEGMSKKLSLQHGQLISQLYSTEAQETLRTRHGNLQIETKTTKRNIREANDKLEEYKQVGGMESVAQEYADILKESEKVRAEIARLEDEGN